MPDAIPALAVSNCEKCPFIDPGRYSADQLKTIIARNYATNYMDCRNQWPDWKPGLCHKGGIVCAGYANR